MGLSGRFVLLAAVLLLMVSACSGTTGEIAADQSPSNTETLSTSAPSPSLSPSPTETRPTTYPSGSHLEVAVLDALSATCKEETRRQSTGSMQGCQTEGGDTFLVSVFGPNGDIDVDRVKQWMITVLPVVTGEAPVAVVGGLGWGVIFIGKTGIPVDRLSEKLDGIMVIESADDLNTFLGKIVAHMREK